jgi:hypothetical protein
MTRDPQTSRARHHEDGYLLVWVIFMLFIFTLWLSVAIPRAAKEIQLDRDRETVERGKQYIRAVQLYYRKFHAYPPNANALVNTNEIRFLRKKYKDPITRKDDWKPIRYGQNKTPTAMGFFGQPLPGNASTIAGVGPGGNGGLGGSATGSPIGGASLGGSGLGGSTFGGSSIFSSGSSGGTASSGSSGTSSTGSSTTPGTSTSSGTSSSGSSTSKSSSSTSSDSSGQTFGGLGIVGFEPASTGTSILLYKKKQHYNEWEFTYDPLTDVRTQSGNSGNIGQPASSTTTPIGSSSSSSDSNSNTSSGSSSSSGSGSSNSSSGGANGGTPNNPPQQ